MPTLIIALKTMKRRIGVGVSFFILTAITLFIFFACYLYGQYTTSYLSQNTFLWLVSTTTQTFGAILGILITGAIFLQSRIDESIQSGHAPRVHVWEILYLPSQSMVVLIAVCLLSLTVMDFFSDRWREIISVFILYYSLFCLALLIRSISSYFTLKIRIK